MAAVFLYGMDSGMVMPDLKSMSKENMEVFRAAIKTEIESGWGVHEDGLVYLIPCMLYWSFWKYCELGRYLEKSANLNLWMTDFYSYIEEQGFKRIQLYQYNKIKEVVYKPGLMPSEPIYDKWFFPQKPLLFWEYNQGGMAYRDIDVWQEANYELAMNGNIRPFQEFVTEKKIIL